MNIDSSEIEMLRQLRMLGCTKFTRGDLSIEFGANVVISGGEEAKSRFTTDEEDEEVFRRVLAKKQEAINSDLYGAT